MGQERASRRKSTFRGTCDPRVHVASGYVTYIEQFYAVSWGSVERKIGWRPSKAVVIPRSKLDAKTIRWLANYNGAKK